MESVPLDTERAGALRPRPSSVSLCFTSFSLLLQRDQHCPCANTITEVDTELVGTSRVALRTPVVDVLAAGGVVAEQAACGCRGASNRLNLVAQDVIADLGYPEVSNQVRDPGAVSRELELHGDRGALLEDGAVVRVDRLEEIRRRGGDVYLEVRGTRVA